MKMLRFVEDAIRVISEQVRSAGSPALFTSFGKDSMAILGLLREANLLSSVELVSFRHPSFPNRYAFADRIISEWSLAPLIVMHRWNSIIIGNGRVDLLGTAASNGSRIHIPVANMVSPDEKRFWFCALDNELPHGVDLIKLDFDLILLGSKRTDEDPVVGKVDVQHVVEYAEGKPSLVFPIKDWTDVQIWEFISAYGIPYEKERYTGSSSVSMVDNVHYPEHSEHLPVCTACINPANSDKVWCPKLRKTIQKRHTPIERRSYPLRSTSGIPEVVAL